MNTSMLIQIIHILLIRDFRNPHLERFDRDAVNRPPRYLREIHLALSAGVFVITLEFGPRGVCEAGVGAGVDGVDFSS